VPGLIVKGRHVLKNIVFNLLALLCSFVVGFLAVDVVAYIWEIPVGAMKMAPFIRGVVVTIFVSLITPRASFRTRFFAYVAIYLLDLALSVNFVPIARAIVSLFYGGDYAAAGSLKLFAVVIPIVSGVVGYQIIRRSVRSSSVVK
jgi:hypothetical protein